MSGIDYTCFIGPIITGFISLLKRVKCGADIYGVVVPQKSGKSFFVNSISSERYCLIDLDENIRLIQTVQERELLNNLNSTSKKLHLYPIALKYVKELRKQHRNKRLIILTSDYEMAKYCGVDNKHVFNFSPSNTLSENIKNSLTDEDKASFEQSKLDLVLKAESVITFSSFDDLAKEIMHRFQGLQLKI